MFKDNADITNLSYDELCLHVNYFITKSSGAFHNGNGHMGAYYLVVSKRFINELENRVVLTEI